MQIWHKHLIIRQYVFIRYWQSIKNELAKVELLDSKAFTSSEGFTNLFGLPQRI
jgi:hypothetical protein